jgi:hypothetical protein
MNSRDEKRVIEQRGAVFSAQRTRHAVDLVFGGGAAASPQTLYFTTGAPNRHSSARTRIAGRNF